MREFLRRSFNYNAWANSTLLKALEAGEPPEKAVAAYQHVLETEHVWFSRLMGEPGVAVRLWETPDLARCHAWTMELVARAEYFLSHLGANGHERVVTYQNSRGDRFSDRTDIVLSQVLMHSAQYRGESAGLAIAAGCPVPDLDFIFWYRAGSPLAWRDPGQAPPVFGSRPLSH